MREAWLGSWRGRARDWGSGSGVALLPMLVSCLWKGGLANEEPPEDRSSPAVDGHLRGNARSCLLDLPTPALGDEKALDPILHVEAIAPCATDLAANRQVP